jgi:hypothetical protein
VDLLLRRGGAAHQTQGAALQRPALRATIIGAPGVRPVRTMAIAGSGNQRRNIGARSAFVQPKQRGGFNCVAAASWPQRRTARTRWVPCRRRPVPAPGVVEIDDPCCDLQAALGTRTEPLSMDVLDLDRRVERLGDGVYRGPSRRGPSTATPRAWRRHARRPRRSTHCLIGIDDDPLMSPLRHDFSEAGPLPA